MTILTTHTAPAAYSALHAVHMTAEAMDYTVDELDDLTDRKIEDVPISGDTLARIVRARRGVARATGDIDHYSPRVVSLTAERAIWPASERTIWGRRTDLRRMAAVGRPVDGTLYLHDEHGYGRVR